eukprot:CAMPEP_0194222000 /NCGR_PEP_ID=MMETSP0156-20130528/31878_1 /TAXON_ID=33649 /ORGANISM="Thalassionema nitzschioides, Strain L26-B" /LENGTH=138 /DNA_ID=CAMNT_0038952611 /DNA_START=44 /DNA_END=456 /DNA_ORIENTATION=+
MRLGLSSIVGGLALLKLVAGNTIRGSRSLSTSPPAKIVESSENSQFKGSMAVWLDNPLTDDATNTIGKATGNCIVPPVGGKRYYCSMTFELEGGNIILQGFEANTAGDLATLGIIGGTGDYEGSTGSYQVEANAAFDT